MIKKTLYFGNPAYLSLRMEQMVIKLPEVEKATDISSVTKEQSVVTRPIEDIGIVVLDNKQITITQGLLEALLENNCAVITCDSQRMPVGLMLPLCGNTVQSERFQDQISASLPLRKQLWQQTVKAKINNQARVLTICSQVESRCMKKWSDDVKSGDSDNQEARAAAYYWKKIFTNIKGLVSSGMLPTFGIHHHNRYNAYCLADDIMEPYRPYVDELVYKIVEKYGADNLQLTKEIKTVLLSIPTIDVVISGKRSPLMVGVTQTTASLYKCFSGEQRVIAYPER